MKRRLWLLNIVLLGLVALTASVLRQRWVEARQREHGLLQQMVPVAPAPALAPLSPVSPATPASYLEVAQKMVFSKDRNPTVILDPPPPPPPPEPMPALPVAYGIMNLGSGPTAIMAEKAGAPSKGYHAGEKIGAFQIVAMNNQEILLQWKDKQVKKRLEELIDKSGRNAPAPAPVQQTAAAPPPPTTVTSLGDTKAGPGTGLGNETRACVPGDTSPPGTVEKGMRKVVTKTPFGESCRWEPVK